MSSSGHLYYLFGENRHTNCCFAQSWEARPRGPYGFTSTVNRRLKNSGSGRRKHNVVSWLKCLGKQLESQSPGPQPGEVPPLTDAGFAQGHWPGSNPCSAPAQAQLHVLLASLSLKFPCVCLKDTSGPWSSGQTPREAPHGPHLHPPLCTLTCTLQQPQPWDLALSYFSLFLSSWQGPGEQGPRPAISLPEGPRVWALPESHPPQNVLSQPPSQNSSWGGPLITLTHK